MSCPCRFESPASARFFFVVGPSGAGKDTLLNGVRAALSSCRGVHFAQRVITRPAGDPGGELHEPVSEARFAALRKEGAFLLDWSAHGLDYGLGADLETPLSAGIHVIANGSRAAVKAAAERLPSLHVIHITAPPEILAARLTGRGRESNAAIRDRLNRLAHESPPPNGPRSSVIINDQTPAVGIAALLRVLSPFMPSCERLKAACTRREMRD